MPVPRGKKGVKMEMERFRRGELHSGSTRGPVVTDPMQAAAIGYRQAGMPKKRGRARGKQSIVDRIDRGKKDYRV